MTNNVADHHPANSVAEGNHEGDFGCSMVELRNLMELRSAEAVARLNDSYGGVQNICKRLKTSPVEGKRPSCGLRGGTTRSGPAGASGLELCEVHAAGWRATAPIALLAELGAWSCCVHRKPCGRWVPASQ